MRMGQWVSGPILAALAIGMVGCASTRTVEPQAVYRSGPLSETELKTAIRDHQIRTVVNFRGFQPDQAWYRRETAVCQAENVEHIDMSLDPKLPGDAEVARLLETFRMGSKPFLLIDSRASTDAEFASGFYKRAVLGEPVAVAAKELPFWQAYRIPLTPGRDRVTVLKDWNGPTEPLAGDPLRSSEPAPPPNRDVADKDTDRRPTFLKRMGDWFGRKEDQYAYSDNGQEQVGARLNSYGGVIPDGPVSDGPVPVDRLPAFRGPLPKGPPLPAIAGADGSGPLPSRGREPTLGRPQPLASITPSIPPVTVSPLPSEQSVRLGPPISVDDAFFLGPDGP